jgi:hydroxypyruvate isomerase
VIKLAANLTMMFADLPFLERIDAAAAAGFRAVECLAPYEVAAEVLAERLRARGVSLVLFNFAIGDWAAGDRGLGADPARTEEFRASLEQALHYARTTGCRQLHLMPGKVPPGADRAAWTETFVANIRLAADAVAGDGIDILLEPINTRVDMPGYFYDTSAAGMAMVEAADRANVKLQYDIYHMQIMEGDLARRIEALLPRIGHVQLADNPGRHEPGTGEINYPWLLGRLEALGYAGWVGCEYRPTGETAASLGWARDYLPPRI